MFKDKQEIENMIIELEKRGLTVHDVIAEHTRPMTNREALGLITVQFVICVIVVYICHLVG